MDHFFVVYIFDLIRYLYMARKMVDQSNNLVSLLFGSTRLGSCTGLLGAGGRL